MNHYLRKLLINFQVFKTEPQHSKRKSNIYKSKVIRPYGIKAAKRAKHKQFYTMMSESVDILTLMGRKAW